MAQRVKNLPTMQETWVQSLGQEDHLEKEMETHSSILVWKIPWTQEPGRLQSVGSQESDMTERLNNNRPMEQSSLYFKCKYTHTHTHTLLSLYR